MQSTISPLIIEKLKEHIHDIIFYASQLVPHYQREIKDYVEIPHYENLFFLLMELFWYLLNCSVGWHNVSSICKVFIFAFKSCIQYSKISIEED